VICSTRQVRNAVLERGVVETSAEVPPRTTDWPRENAALKLIPGAYGNFRALFPAFVRRESAYGYRVNAQLYVAMRTVGAVAKASAEAKQRTTTGQWMAARFCSLHLTNCIKESSAWPASTDFVVTTGSIDGWAAFTCAGQESEWRCGRESQNSCGYFVRLQLAASVPSA